MHYAMTPPNLLQLATCLKLSSVYLHRKFTKEKVEKNMLETNTS